jgi:hypothetical protein
MRPDPRSSPTNVMTPPPPSVIRAKGNTEWRAECSRCSRGDVKAGRSRRVVPSPRLGRPRCISSRSRLVAATRLALRSHLRCTQARERDALVGSGPAQRQRTARGSTACARGPRCSTGSHCRNTPGVVQELRDRHPRTEVTPALRGASVTMSIGTEHPGPFVLVQSFLTKPRRRESDPPWAVPEARRGLGREEQVRLRDLHVPARRAYDAELEDEESFAGRPVHWADRRANTVLQPRSKLTAKPRSSLHRTRGRRSSVVA